MRRSTTLALTLALVAADLSSCAATDAPPPATTPWRPGTILPAEGAVARGLVDVRGLVHAHSVYSHDACDGEPVLPDGTIDGTCFDDFRRGLCQSRHDFVFLTDHGDRFTETPFPDVLLYRPERGDVLVERGGRPVANRILCDDGRSVLVMAGSENGLMPVGIEAHVDEDEAVRASVYGARDQASADRLREAGAIVLLAHPEDFSVDELRALPVDGFEMYNLHQNTLLGGGFALDILLRANNGEPGLLHPDLLVFAIVSEDPDYLERWGRVLAGGKRLTTTMGTDCHRNTFKTIMADGERGDSYRRMMISFANHLLVRPAAADGLIDDADLKEALRAGRLFGVFEMFGHPVGLDMVATKDGATFEMGDVVPAGATIRVTTPTVRDLDPAAEPPRLVTRVLRAVDEVEGFVEVGRSEGSILEVVAAEPGVYRAEVRMMPWHLREHLGFDDVRLLDEADLAGTDYVWVYGNPFYVQ
jgi:hypothetical protein